MLFCALAAGRDAAGLKRFFIEKCCDRNKKPTGTSRPTELIRQSQKKYQRILMSADAAVYGYSSGEEFAGSGSASSSDVDDFDDLLFKTMLVLPFLLMPLIRYLLLRLHLLLRREDLLPLQIFHGKSAIGRTPNQRAGETDQGPILDLRCVISRKWYQLEG
jgi:hypothetical protein